MSSSTFDTVAGIISETCDIPREKITPESHAINDLGIDSLDFLDVAFAIDKAFGIKMPLEQWTQEVNEGKVSSDRVFRAEEPLRATSTRWSRPRPPDVSTRMRLEYFQMVDRIVALDPDGADDARRVHRPRRRARCSRAISPAIRSCPAC